MMFALSHDGQIELTRAIFKTIDAWQVPKEMQPALLGLDPTLKSRTLNRYRLGRPLPNDPAVYARLALLLKIDNAVHKLFPRSELSANLWVTTPRVKLGGLTPLEIMLKQGIDGLRSIEQGLYNLDVW
jgi:hypothetical protein